jgi:hypothetical protein
VKRKLEEKMKRLQRNLEIDMAYTINEGDHAMVMVQAGITPNTYQAGDGSSRQG